MRHRQATFNYGQGATANDALQAFDEIGTFAEIYPIREPDHFDIGGSCKKALDRRQRVGAIEAIGLGLDLLSIASGPVDQIQQGLA